MGGLTGGIKSLQRNDDHVPGAEKTGAQSEIIGQEIIKERIIDLTLEQ